MCGDTGGMRLAASAATGLGMLPCACGAPDRSAGDGAGPEPRPAQGIQVGQSFKGGTGAPFHYLLYLPQRYGDRKGRPWPLLLFLHGADTPGSTRCDLELLRPRGLPRILERRDLPLIAV